MEAHRARKYAAPTTSQTSSRLRGGDVVKARVGDLAVWCSASAFLSSLDDHQCGSRNAAPRYLDNHCSSCALLIIDLVTYIDKWISTYETGQETGHK